MPALRWHATDGTGGGAGLKARLIGATHDELRAWLQSDELEVDLYVGDVAHSAPIRCTLRVADLAGARPEAPSAPPAPRKASPVRLAARATCSFAGCDRLVATRGLCPQHYKQQRLGLQLRPIRAWRRRAGPTTPPAGGAPAGPTAAKGGEADPIGQAAGNCAYCAKAVQRVPSGHVVHRAEMDSVACPALKDWRAARGIPKPDLLKREVPA